MKMDGLTTDVVGRPTEGIFPIGTIGVKRPAYRISLPMERVTLPPVHPGSAKEVQLSPVAAAPVAAAPVAAAPVAAAPVVRVYDEAGFVEMRHLSPPPTTLPQSITGAGVLTAAMPDSMSGSEDALEASAPEQALGTMAKLKKWAPLATAAFLVFR